MSYMFLKKGHVQTQREVILKKDEEYVLIPSEEKKE